MAKTIIPKLHNVWKDMKSRCNNPNDKAFYRYGGRGIKYQSSWEIFKNFSEDMLPTYKKGLWLDRVDNNGNYCKENCGWRTPQEQNNNRRGNIVITFNNLTKTLEQWSRFLNIKSSTLRQRYFTYKWDIEKCLERGATWPK
jgi:hypothetical protein